MQLSDICTRTAQVTNLLLPFAPVPLFPAFQVLIRNTVLPGVTLADKLQWLALPGISRKQARRTRLQATKSEGHCPHKPSVA